MDLKYEPLDQLTYESLIEDAERRIGSYIASGGSSEDIYVKGQVEKIRQWSEKLAKTEGR